MRAVVFSDTHFHEWSYGSKLVHGENSRLRSTYEAVMEMCRYIQSHGIDFAFFCGDLFHTHGKVSAASLQMATHAIHQLKSVVRETVFLVGNHDMKDKRGKIHSLNWLSHPFDGTCTIVTDPTYLNIGNRDIGAMGYVENPGLALPSFFAEGGTSCLYLLHQGVQGVPMASGWVPDEYLCAGMVPTDSQAFTGHYHTHKQVDSGLCVVGSLTQQTWADVGQARGFIDLDLATLDWKFVPVTSAPIFVKLTKEEAFRDDVVLFNSFVKITDCDFNDRQEVRDTLTRLKSALTVEFELLPEEIKTTTTAVAKDNFDLNELFNAVGQSLSPNELEIGVQLKEDRFEIPELPSQ